MKRLPHVDLVDLAHTNAAKAGYDAEQDGDALYVPGFVTGYRDAESGCIRCSVYLSPEPTLSPYIEGYDAGYDRATADKDPRRRT